MAHKPPKRNGRISSNEDFIGHHMCNHYRRILNAKKVVDTSPPLSYKNRLPAKKSSTTNKIIKSKESRHLSPAMTDRSLSTNSYKASSWGTESFTSSSRYHTKCIPPEPSLVSSRKQALLDMNLIDRITYDTKNGPSAYCDKNWTEMKEQDTGKKVNVPFDVSARKKETDASTSKQHVQIKNQSKSTETPTFRTLRKPSKVVSKQIDSYTSFAPKFRPRILKTEAVSKLRSLRVYYPPRRKKKRETENYWDESNEKAQGKHRKSFDVCICCSNEIRSKKPVAAVKEQTSSRDSAYNGGVSSLPESRSPTPDHRKKVMCTCGAPLETQTKTREIWNYISKEDRKSPETVSQPNVPLEKAKSEEEEAFKKMKEDALYVKFLQDITVEVLEKGLFTNKAIKKVMRKHIMNNLQTLEKNRMIKEVENLRIQLGVPEDKTLLEVEDISEDSSGCLLQAYAVISDSAFTLPENIGENKTEATEFNKNESQVLQGAEGKCEFISENDFCSMNQIEKKIRERMRSADSSSEEGNSNRKKRPKVSKFPKTKNGSVRSSCSSSSSSEGETVTKAWDREHQKHRLGKKLWSSTCKCDEKRNRSVTFDQMNLGRHRGNKPVPVIMCVNNFQNDDPKVKAKND